MSTISALDQAFKVRDVHPGTKLLGIYIAQLGNGRVVRVSVPEAAAWTGIPTTDLRIFLMRLPGWSIETAGDEAFTATLVEGSAS